MPSLKTLLLQAANEVATTFRNEQQHQEEEEGEEQYTFYYNHEEYATTTNIFITIVSIIKRIIWIFILFSFLLIISIFVYGLFYLFMMPSDYTTKPLYFDYNYKPPSCSRGRRDISNKSNNATMKTCRSNNLNTHPNYHPTTIIPTAKIDLLSQHTQWHPYKDDVAPSRYPKRILQPNKKYFIDVALLLPDSILNQNLGMFMIEVDLMDETTTTTGSSTTLLATSKRSTMLPYQSSLIRLAKKLVWFIPLLIGAIPEATNVVVKCFDHFIESEEFPLSSVTTRLIIPSPTTQSTIQVLSAELRIGKELNALQCLMKEWFYTCGFFGTLLIMFFEIILFFVYQAWQNEMRMRREEEEEEEATEQRYYRNRVYDYDDYDDDDVSDDVFVERHDVKSARNEEEEEEEWLEFDDMNNMHDWEEYSVKDSDSSVKKSDEVRYRTCDGSIGDDDDDEEEELKEEPDLIIESFVDNARENENKKNTQKSSKQSENGETKTTPKNAIKRGFQKPVVPKRSAEDDERIQIDRVMKGLYQPYEIFTDLDDPDLCFES